MGFSLKSILRKIQVLREFKSKNKDAEGLIIYSMYGSLHGYIVRIILGKDFNIVNSFGGSDILGSTNSSAFWNIRNSLTKYLSLWTAKRVNHVVVKSSNLLMQLGSKLINQSSVIPNGVDLKIFKELDSSDLLRNSFGWKPDEFVVLFSLRRGNSALEAVKNYALAEEVINRLRELTEKEVHLEIISNKSHSEMNELFNAADCLLLTSLHEGSPNIVKEAMACNLPVLSVPCGDVLERLSNVNNSYVSSSYNAIELASLGLMISEKNMKSNGRESLINQGLDMESVAKSLIKVFKSVLNDK